MAASRRKRHAWLEMTTDRPSGAHSKNPMSTDRVRGDRPATRSVHADDHDVVRAGASPVEIGDLRAGRGHPRSAVTWAVAELAQAPRVQIAHLDDPLRIGEDHQAVPGDAEWRRQRRLSRAREQRDPDEGCEEQQGHECRESSRRDDGRGRPHRDVHGKPPFEEAPRRALPRAGGPREELGSSRRSGPRRGRPRIPGRARSKRRSALMPGSLRRPGSRVRVASGPRPARISPSARCRRDFTVPTGMPRAAATSVSGIPR